MVKHQPLQVYERQLCLSCLTGIYGCRWKRYQRSHDDTTKWECLWSVILFGTFLLLLVWFYFWWEAHNDYNEFNWFLYNRSGEWSDGTVPILATTAAGFTYIAFLVWVIVIVNTAHCASQRNVTSAFDPSVKEQWAADMGSTRGAVLGHGTLLMSTSVVLALCHIAVGQQLNLHWLHKIGVSAALLTTLIGVISVSQMWGEEWNIVPVSLQATGPFLHIGALAAVTALSWLVAGQVARAEKTKFQIIFMLIYLAVLLCLYLTPLSISSPCIMERDSLKERPAVIGHQGAPMLAPENTLLSFQRALQMNVSGLEAEVAISQDGVPFLMRDQTLRRTTDVSQVFPERQFEDASFFTWTDLRSLNAGQWFLENDPYWTVQFMSDHARRLVGNQSVCSLEQMLQLAARSNRSVLFTLRRPPPQHPHFQSWVNVTLAAVLRSGIPQHLVMWSVDWDRDLVQREAPELRQTSMKKKSLETLRQEGISSLVLRYSQATAQDVRTYTGGNVSVTLYTVNDPWLYSVLWCSGVPSVSSDAPQVLKKVLSPLWMMSPEQYTFIWVTTDLISFGLVIGIFVFQNYHMIRWRMSGMRSYNPEQIMLSAAVGRSNRDVNIMKEKLIFSEVSNGVSNEDNGFDFYTHQGVH